MIHGVCTGLERTDLFFGGGFCFSNRSFLCDTWRFDFGVSREGSSLYVNFNHPF